jgi:4-hydroxy-tetrahydrodipicolinate synthase
MSSFIPGLVHTPVTPFGARRAIDDATREKLIEFHLACGADALALPLHVAESVSLSDEEQRKLLAAVLKQVRGRVPVLAHVSDSGTAIAAARARHAEDVGAAALMVTTPYYWTPPPGMLLEHFSAVGGAVRIPCYLWHTPEEMGSSRITPDLVCRLIDAHPNFAGVIDSSMDWQFQINVLSSARRKRADFQLLAGNEYMVSAGANGATGMLTSLAGIAPRLLRRLHDLCRSERYREARGLQENVAALRQAVKRAGFGGLKHALQLHGRDCGVPRPPMRAVDEEAARRMAAELQQLRFLGDEPRGW